MRGKLPAVVGALVAALLLGGCYGLRESNWTKDKVEAGKATTFQAKLLGGSGNPSHFFIMPRLQSDEVSIRKPVFDVKEKVGTRKKLVEDAVLGQVAVDTGEGCDAGAGSLSEQPRAYKTANEIVPAEGKFVDATFKAKVASGATGDQVGGVVFVGYWDDDGDGIPEGTNDDAINCTGFTSTAFLVK